MKRTIFIAVVLTVLSVCGSFTFASVSYLGPAGTYTEEATIQFFGQNEKILPASTVAEALSMLKAGKCEYAVVPTENTIRGPVYNYLDAVLADEYLTVVGEVDLPIRQTLLGVPGGTITQIKTILSHPQGIAQSKKWIKANIPDAKLVEVSSTAEAARQVASASDTSMAAIAAARTAGVYKLNILANDLQYTNDNVTRFWVVTIKGKVQQSGDKAAALVRGNSNAVIKMLYELIQMGYKVHTLHDRPTKEKLGEYQYVIEVEGLNPSYTLERIIANPDLELSGRVLGTFR